MNSSTTDGGGENVGHGGIHAQLEESNPSHVARRCTGHMGWRDCDQAIAAGGTLKTDSTLAAYFCDDVTWQRLQALATKSICDGGLALFREGSNEHHAIVRAAPSAILDGRPESHYNFLKWLHDKSHILERLASKDIADRRLKSVPPETLASLKSKPDCVKRSVLCEVLHRCLHICAVGNKKRHIAAETTFRELVESEVKMILALDLTDHSIANLGATRQLIADKQWHPQSWVQLAVLLIYDDERAAEIALPEALDFHRRVSTRAATHLQLTAANILNTQWLAQELLSRHAPKAQASARTLVRHLTTTPPTKYTPFERELVQEEQLWSELVDFSNTPRALLLWRGRGRFANLFRFLASRFLVGPDHVLDCERLHARWKWISDNKRGIRLPLLNAWLKLTCFLESHDWEFPDDRELEEHLADAHRQLRQMYGEVADADEVARGWRHAFMFRERFNLEDDAQNLIVEPAAKAPSRDTFDKMWGTYVRQLFVPGRFYSFQKWPHTFILVTENKVKAGRDARFHDEALGRDLALAFFRHDEADPVGLVRRVDQTFAGLKSVLVTAAALLLHIGEVLPPLPVRTAQEQEAHLEERFGNLVVEQWDSVLETASDEVHVHNLSNPQDFEDVLFEETPLDNLTSMALARFLERSTGADRRREQRNKVTDLMAQVAALRGVPAPVPRRLLRARGRGRGAPLLPAPAAPGAPLPPVPPAPPAPPAPAAPGRGRRGRGRGR